MITAPGVYALSPDEYHSDPVEGGSLSSSGARRLLATCPAKWRYEQDHPVAPTSAMNLGSAAHRLILGVGAELVEIGADNYRTVAAREARDAALEAGDIPLLPDEYQQVQDMAAALCEHPTAAALFDPARGGSAEQALIWQDGRAGIWRRALLDWLPAHRTASGRLVIPDYKTCRDASPDALSKAIQTFGYHQQAAYYLDGVKALGLDEAPMFLLVFQEVTAPYLVHVVQPHPIAMDIGADLNREAIDLYARCQQAGAWPGYGDDIDLIRLPGWAENQHI